MCCCYWCDSGRREDSKFQRTFVRRSLDRRVKKRGDYNKISKTSRLKSHLSSTQFYLSKRGLLVVVFNRR